MEAESCPRRDALQATCAKIWERVKSITAESLKSLEANDKASLMALDRELENTIGEKERAFGAFWEHTKEHGC